MTKPIDYIPDDQRHSPDKMQWDIALLKSRYESEQRQRVEANKLLDAARRMIEMQQNEISRLGKEVDECKKMLLNTGSGLMFSVRDLQNSDKNSKDTLTRVLAIVSLLITLGTLISRFIKI